MVKDQVYKVFKAGSLQPSEEYIDGGQIKFLSQLTTAVGVQRKDPLSYATSS